MAMCCKSNSTFLIHYNSNKCIKKQQFKTVFNDDKAYITQLKRQK